MCTYLVFCRYGADYTKEQVYFLGNAAEMEIFCPRGNQPWCMKCAEDTGCSAYYASLNKFPCKMCNLRTTEHHQQAAERAVMKLLHQQLQTLYFQWWGQQQFSFCAKETN